MDNSGPEPLAHCPRQEILKHPDGDPRMPDTKHKHITSANKYAEFENLSFIN